MLIVYRGKDMIEANIVAGLIQSHGIHCHVEGNYLQGGMGEIGTSGFSNVRVEDEDFDQARALVEEYEQDRHMSPIEAVAEPAGTYQVNRLSRVFLIVCTVIIGLLWMLSGAR
ncbi:MAG: DUF2007 domain-containing protein [Halomonadaceae bacterium]|nr:MAG: DUF2007 domain-containing protein [Halomonadaceae bacterium]